MAKERTERPGAPDEERDGWRHVVAFGSLVGSILAVLTLGSILRTDPASATPAAPLETRREVPLASPAARARTEIATAATAATAATTATPAAPPLTDLRGRAASDLDRLSRLGGGYTAQLAVLCEEQSARSIVERFAAEPALYVVPAAVKDRSCYMLSWSHYETREAAVEARDLPAGLRAVQPAPFPRRVAEIVR